MTCPNLLGQSNLFSFQSLRKLEFQIKYNFDVNYNSLFGFVILSNKEIQLEILKYHENPIEAPMIKVFMKGISSNFSFVQIALCKEF